MNPAGGEGKVDFTGARFNYLYVDNTTDKLKKFNFKYRHLFI